MTTTTTTLVSAPVQEPQTAPADVIEVVVSLRHIEMGRSEDGLHCAIEWALIDQGFVSPIVGNYRMWLDDEPIDLPEHVQDWIGRFDNGEQVEPERFLIPRSNPLA